MRLVDTSAWIEWLVGSALGTLVGAQLPEPETWLVPTMVQLELSRWMAREIAEEKADKILAFMATCVVVPLDTPLALAAAALGARFKLSTADSIIYATARTFDAELLTCDAHFRGLDGVSLFEKAIS